MPTRFASTGADFTTASIPARMSARSPPPKYLTLPWTNDSPNPKLPRGLGRNTKYPCEGSIPVHRVGQSASAAPDGPPCATTTIGYRFFASNPRGGASQPCTRLPALSQCSDVASPHKGLTPALIDVRAFHAPTGPARTSGASRNELNAPADAVPERAIANARIDSGPLHKVERRTVFGSRDRIANPPSWCAPITISPYWRPSSIFAGGRLPGLRVTGVPPT